MQTTTRTPQTLSLDMEAIHARARKHMMDGPAPESLGIPKDRIIAVLNEVLASEIVCHLRYLAHAYQAEGIRAEVAVEEFREHADQERVHMDMVAERIAQLNGLANFSPEGLMQRSHAAFGTVQEDTTLEEMIEQDLLSERVAVDTYRQIVRWLGDHDPTTRRIMEEILVEEEDHADDMRSLMASFRSDV